MKVIKLFMPLLCLLWPAMIPFQKKGFACKKYDTRVKNYSLMKINVDTSKIAIIPYSDNWHWMFKNAKSAALSDEECMEVEKILIKSIDTYNASLIKRLKERKKYNPNYKSDLQTKPIKPANYKRQYVTVTNGYGQKEVWVNCFCQVYNHNWKSELFLVNDGGNCYFNVKINLSTGGYYEFSVNIEA